MRPLSFAVAGALLISVPALAEEPDALLTIPVTPQTIARGIETDADTLGVQAYVWGYPLVRMERIARQYTTVSAGNPGTSYRAPLDRIGWATDLATAAAKDMPTANNDTFYMSAVVDLKEPFILSVPDTHDRYYVVNVFNMWQELQHYIGHRTTGTAAARYAIVPPGWSGTLPQGVTRLDVSTDKVWLWGRLRIAEGEDKGPVLALQKQFTLVPLSLFGKADIAPAVAPLSPLPAIEHDDLGFFTQLGAALKDNAVQPADQALFAQFARIGLTANGFDASKLSPQGRQGLVRALTDAPAVAVSAMVTAATQRNGWTWAVGLDSFVFNYPLRALVAGPYLGGNGEQEAMYPLRYTDSAGQLLSGAHSYTLRFDHALPVDAFWSLTVYNAQDKLLVDNPIDRYKVGSDTRGLVTSADGSVTVYAQHVAPAQPANWLPTPEGPFYLVLRLYQPKADVLDGHYSLPEVVAGVP